MEISWQEFAQGLNDGVYTPLVKEGESVNINGTEYVISGRFSGLSSVPNRDNYVLEDAKTGKPRQFTPSEVHDAILGTQTNNKPTETQGVKSRQNEDTKDFVTNLAQKPTSIGDLANILQNIVNASDDVSKVVDENGEPKKATHGTSALIYEFDKATQGEHAAKNLTLQKNNGFMFVPKPLRSGLEIGKNLLNLKRVLKINILT